jgi:hypothetical protein
LDRDKIPNYFSIFKIIALIFAQMPNYSRLGWKLVSSGRGAAGGGSACTCIDGAEEVEFKPTACRNRYASNNKPL